MTIEVSINNSTSPQARYVTWAPSPCRVRLTSATGAPSGSTVSVQLRNKAGNKGIVVFRKTATGASSSTLKVSLPVAGSSVNFFVAGKFGKPSVADQDCVIQAVVGTTVVGEFPLMVRIRKDATKLTPAERDRFVAAMAQLNDRGLGRFTDFRDMHRNSGAPEAHGNAGFLPWHRAYLLDLERELQAIDPSVALPYWRFDRPAPSIFTPDFMGTSNSIGTVSFSPSNPLQFWKSDGVVGINRRPLFNTASAPGVLDEAGTLGLGNQFAAFTTMEGDPHGSAHVSFSGFLNSVPTAPRDPMFFMLHANVDRLWAKWQRANNRFDQATPASFASNLPGGNRIGHNLGDTMWPWNGVTTPPRPSTAPGGTLAASVCVSAPGLQPKVGDLLDLQGRVAPAGRLGYDYDDVPFS